MRNDKEAANKSINYLAICSSVVLLVVSTALAFLGKTAEMGLTIAAGFIGLAFANIDKIKKFSAAGVEAEMRDVISALARKEAEPEVNSEDAEIISKKFELSSSQINVLSALANPSYTWRTVSGVAEETGLSRVSVNKILKELSDLALVCLSVIDKRALWSLTDEGRVASRANPSKASA